MQAPVRKAQNSAILKTSVLCIRIPFKTENAAGHRLQTKAEETRHLHSQSIHGERTVEVFCPLHKNIVSARSHFFQKLFAQRPCHLAGQVKQHSHKQLQRQSPKHSLRTLLPVSQVQAQHGKVESHTRTSAEGQITAWDNFRPCDIQLAKSRLKDPNCMLTLEQSGIPELTCN